MRDRFGCLLELILLSFWYEEPILQLLFLLFLMMHFCNLFTFKWWSQFIRCSVNHCRQSWIILSRYKYKVILFYFPFIWLSFAVKAQCHSAPVVFKYKAFCLWPVFLHETVAVKTETPDWESKCELVKVMYLLTVSYCLKWHVSSLSLSYNSAGNVASLQQF